MAHNDKKILSVIIEEAQQIEQRCPGYNDKLVSLLRDVLNYEQEHAIAKINITKKIGAQVNTIGKFLNENRPEKPE
jgi:hypothetical protein